MLYPALLLAALAIIVVSVIGIMVATDILPDVRGGEASATNRAPLERPFADSGKAPLPPESQPGKSNTSRSVSVIARTVATPSVSCADCGVIESITTAAGGHGGGQAQTEITEKAVAPAKRYQIRVRMNDGNGLIYEEADVTAYAVGQKVRATRAGIVVAGG